METQIQTTNIDVFSLSDEEKRILGYLCASDFKTFVATCLFDLFGFPFCEFHDFVSDLIQNRLGTKLRFAVAAPRGTGKSTLITEAATAWLILRNEYLNLHPKDPRNKKYVVIVSDTIGQAIERLSAVKDLIEDNEIIAELFPRSSGAGPTWTTEYIISNSNVAVRALGTGSKIRGRRFGVYRPDCIFLDDCENIEQVTSESMRVYLHEWFTRDLLKAGDAERTDVIFIGTIISRQALLYKLLYSDEFPGWEGKVFKAINSWPERMDLWDQFGEILKDRTNPKAKDEAIAFYYEHKKEMDKGAEILWPQRFTLLDLMIEYYYLGRRVFMLEMQNEVIENTERVFEIDKYYYYTDEEFESIPQSRLLYYMFVDPATGKKKGTSRKKSTDMFACVVIAKDVVNNVYYLVDYYADIIPPQKQFHIIENFISLYPIYRFYVESNTSQFYYFESIKDYLKAKKIFMPVPRQYINKHNKERRIEALTTYLENWTLRLSVKHRKVINDLDMYPAIEYDDLLDCLSSCFFASFKTNRIIYV